VTNIRLLPVVILAVAALLVLKTVGLVTNGGYVLGGVTPALAAGGGGGHGGGEAAAGEPITLPSEPTLEDTTPTLAADVPTLGEEGSDHGPGDHGAAAETGGHGEAEEGGDGASQGHAEDNSAEAAPAEEPPANVIAAENACAAVPVAGEGEEPSADGELTVLPADCALPEDAIPQLLTPEGMVPLNAGDATLTEQALLERLATRREELAGYEQELAMRASLVEAAEQRITERQETLQAIETQIASLVEERKAMEEGQFAGIVAMYETMKPKDAATIFNALDIEVLFRVAKMMSPRKMAPILAEMDTQRAQELTVRMASASADPLESMTQEDLDALPQIVGQ
jgi:flagellar motility protein MotE (MotC chaperone)